MGDPEALYFWRILGFDLLSQDLLETDLDRKRTESMIWVRFFIPVRFDFDLISNKRSGTKEPVTSILTSFHFCLLHFVSASNSLHFILA